MNSVVYYFRTTTVFCTVLDCARTDDLLINMIEGVKGGR